MAEKTPPHDQLNRLLEMCAECLAHAWSYRQSDDNILCLGDLNREDCRAAAHQFWKAVGNPSPPGVHIEGPPDASLGAYLQLATFIDALEQSPIFDVKRAAKELREFGAARKAGMDIVPVFVVLLGGCWAIMWNPPGSNLVSARHKPNPEPGPN